MEIAFQEDIAAVQRIAALPALFDTVCKMSGVGFAAVARMTEDRWITCATKDDIHLGLMPGSEVDIKTTICHVARHRKGRAIVIDHTARDPVFRDHPTLNHHGLQSYITVPIRLPDDTVFGTLCGGDTRPHRLSAPPVVEMFTIFARLVGLHVDKIKRLDDAVDQFTPTRPTRTASATAKVINHLSLAQSVAADPEHRTIRQAIELALYLAQRKS